MAADEAEEFLLGATDYDSAALRPTSAALLISAQSPYDVTALLDTATYSALGMGEAEQQECISMNDSLTGDWTTRTSVMVVFALLYAVIIFAGIVGNLCVIAAIARTRALQTVPNMFIFSLSCSDVVVCFTSATITPFTAFRKEWIFGGFLCSLFPVIAGLSLCFSTFTLAAISVDRFILIRFPTKRPFTHTQAAAVICFILLMAACLSMPSMFMQALRPVAGYCGRFCFEEWPSAAEGWIGGARRAYGTIMLTLQFLLPLSVIVVCYTAISLRLGKSLTLHRAKHQRTHSEYEWQRELNDQQRAALKRRQRTNRMFIAMVVAFSVSWSWNIAFNVLRDYDLWPEFVRRQEFFFGIATHCMAMTSTVWNPILYALLNLQLRAAFVQLVPVWMRRLWCAVVWREKKRKLGEDRGRMNPSRRSVRFAGSGPALSGSVRASKAGGGDPSCEDIRAKGISAPVTPICRANRKDYTGTIAMSTHAQRSCGHPNHNHHSGCCSLVGREHSNGTEVLADGSSLTPLIHSQHSQNGGLSTLLLPPPCKTVDNNSVGIKPATLLTALAITEASETEEVVTENDSLQRANTEDRSHQPSQKDFLSEAGGGSRLLSWLGRSIRRRNSRNKEAAGEPSQKASIPGRKSNSPTIQRHSVPLQGQRSCQQLGHNNADQWWSPSGGGGSSISADGRVRGWSEGGGRAALERIRLARTIARQQQLESSGTDGKKSPLPHGRKASVCKALTMARDGSADLTTTTTSTINNISSGNSVRCFGGSAAIGVRSADGASATTAFLLRRESGASTATNEGERRKRSWRHPLVTHTFSILAGRTNAEMMSSVVLPHPAVVVSPPPAGPEAGTAGLSLR